MNPKVKAFLRTLHEKLTKKEWEMLEVTYLDPDSYDEEGEPGDEINVDIKEVQDVVEAALVHTFPEAFGGS